MDQLPWSGKRELICLLLFTCDYVVFVWRGFLFLWVLGMGYVILLWHSLSLPYNYFESFGNYNVCNRLFQDVLLCQIPLSFTDQFLNRLCHPEWLILDICSKCDANATNEFILSDEPARTVVAVSKQFQSRNESFQNKVRS